MDPAPEIDRYLQKANTRSNLNSLLLNGNIATPVSYAKKTFLLMNTCPFDALACIITMAYTDIASYKLFMDNNNNQMLKFCKNLALNGPSKTTYIDRLELLKPIFKGSDNIAKTHVIDSRCNVAFVITKLLQSAPSAIQEMRCSNKMCKNYKKTVESPTLIIRSKTKGFTELQQSIEDYIKEKTYDCGICEGEIRSSRKLMPHLFIETDIFKENGHFQLNEFPTELRINDDT